MDDYLKEETQKNLARAQSVLVVVAKDADFDALASGLALYLCLKKFGKNVSITGPAPKVSDAQSLYAVDQISKENSVNNLVITIDGAIDKVDKVSHFLDGKILKLVIHSLPGSVPVTKEDIQFEYSTISADLIFAVGYNSQDQLEKEVTHEHNINPNVWIVSINKGNLSQKFAQVSLYDPNVYSTCELTAGAIKALNLPLDEDIAFNLYAGLSHATQMFSPSIATPTTFEIAQYLIKSGAGNASLARSAGQLRSASSVFQSVTASGENAKQPLGISQTPPANFPQVKQGNYPKFFDRSKDQKPIEDVEREEGKEAWLKPPKIYRGSKSFDSES